MHWMGQHQRGCECDSEAWERAVRDGEGGQAGRGGL